MSIENINSDYYYKELFFDSQENNIADNNKALTLEKFTQHRQNIDKKYYIIGKKYNDNQYLYRAERVKICGNFLEFALFQKAGLKLINANFCMDRLCNMCNWRRSLKIFVKLSKIIKSQEIQDKKYNFLFLTLTLENVEPKDLHQGLNHIFYSFNKFLKNKRIKNINKGYFRALEITYNPISNTFHHHLHIVLAVNKTYFKKPDLYLKQTDFADIWQSSAGIDYTPIVHIQKFKSEKGIAEASKYSVKVDNKLLKNISIDNLKILRDELSNRRLVGMGGIIRDIAKKLKLNLDSDDKLTDDFDDIKDDILLAILRYKFNIGFGKYELIEKENVNF
ncbi:protein rep [[Clostridium] scindens]|uniref:protein rep n=1 Tax=Clostridium scindens (strain JCM 10418 / VPI 12708) TaxID=29347 RepID=UPI002096D929|nr:protein rep [[Clostridium] scindens]MCO7174471.1 protein rep [[Clostridium] scindens]